MIKWLNNAVLCSFLFCFEFAMVMKNNEHGKMGRW
jgi:hypothetical protein